MQHFPYRKRQGNTSKDYILFMHTHTCMKVKISVNFPSSYAYKPILYFIDDKRLERKRWCVHDSGRGVRMLT